MALNNRFNGGSLAVNSRSQACKCGRRRWQAARRVYESNIVCVQKIMGIAMQRRAPARLSRTERQNGGWSDGATNMKWCNFRALDHIMKINPFNKIIRNFIRNAWCCARRKCGNASLLCKHAHAHTIARRVEKSASASRRVQARACGQKKQQTRKGGMLLLRQLSHSQILDNAQNMIHVMCASEYMRRCLRSSVWLMPQYIRA